MTDKIVVFVTVGNSENAAVLAKSLVAKRLAVRAWYPASPPGIGGKRE